MKLIADLHIHSVLSPCGDFEMTPRNIVRRVKELGLNTFSITDHNSIGNLLPFKKVAEKENLKFIFGMEVQTEEEVHVLTYFESYESIRRVWNIIYKKLPAVNNSPDYFGEQILVNDNDDIPDHNLFSLLEISDERDVKKLKEKFGFLKNFNFVSFSDAHYLKDIGRSITVFYLEGKENLILALNRGKVRIRRICYDE